MKTDSENYCVSVCGGIAFSTVIGKISKFYNIFTFYNFLRSVDENLSYALVCSKK